MPTRAVFGVMRQTALQGSAKYSPFMFSGRLRRISFVDFFRVRTTLPLHTYYYY